MASDEADRWSVAMTRRLETALLATAVLAVAGALALTSLASGITALLP